MWWAKPKVLDLAPATYFPVEIFDAEEGVVATAEVATLPVEGSNRFQLVFGSCFDVFGSHAAVLDQAYDILSGAATADMSYNVWLGDQVYVDAPWAKATRATDARRTIYDRYLRSWGIRADSGLARVMRESSNWYLPDDHEFWNGYPDPSWLTLFWHTFKRFARQVWRTRPTSDSLPHPASQGEWGSTAGEAYCVFASDLEFDEFDESVSPSGVQRIEIGDVVVVVVDTRWRRTIRKAFAGAGFMLDEDLDGLVSLLGSETRTVCLALSRPIVGYLPRRSVSPGATDGGPELYARQYTRLWKALARRAAVGRPTLTVAGDVHRHAVRSALGDGLIEVVSSPMSLLEALDERSSVSRVRNVLGRVGSGIRGAEMRLRSLEPVVDFPYPEFGDGLAHDDDEWDGASRAGSEFFLAGAGRSGIAGVEFDTSEPAGPVVTVRTIVEPEMLPGELFTSQLRFAWQPNRGWVAIP